MSAIAVELLLIVVLIVVNGVLAMSELAVVSARKARLQQRAEEGNAGARVALELADHPSRFLSTIQIGITLVGILTGAFGGATVAAQIDARLEEVPALAPYSEAIGLVVVVIAITYVSLIMGELVPKRLALHNPEGIAVLIARPMARLSKVAGPVVSLLTISTEAVLRVLGVRASQEAPVSEEEIKVMIAQGTEAGVFHRAEQDLVDRVLSLDDRTVGKLMTPRLKVVWLDLDDPPEVNWRKIATSPHGHFPIGRGDLDNVVGMVSVRDLWAQTMAGQAPDLEQVAQTPLYVPESLRALRVLDVFRQSETPMEVAIVIGEHGGTEGLITLTDLLEAIVGDLPPASQADAVQAVQRDDGSWLVDGALPVEELQDLLGVKELPDTDRRLYHTVGGFLMVHLRRVPQAGDRFDWDGVRFEVVDMDGRRVDKVLVTPTQAAAANRQGTA
ncbi:MAG: hemolysin family protein [Chloroflexota bacterium]